jgi:CO/xanthine dehydrogenase Mo-binding subunit
VKGSGAVGKSVLKNDVLDRVTGKGLYTADIELDGMLYGKVLRSKTAHALVKNIDTARAKKIPGVVKILTYRDIPGENGVGIILKDEPVLVKDKIRRFGDAIALVAAETEQAAEEALELIDVETEEMPVVTDVIAAMDENAPAVHGKTNILAAKTLLKGDPDKAFKECDIIIENTYKTSPVAHMFIEPQAAVAKYEDNLLTFWCSTQNPHFDRGEVARVLKLPKNRVRGIQAETGGGFGGKLDIAAQCHAALLAYHTGRPVKIVHTYEETMYTSSKRHMYIMKYKTGASKDGKLIAMEAELIIDTGAYASYGPGVLTRGMVHSTGPYEIPNVRVKGYLVYTNNPMAGAMRGFGVPQVAIAHESQMDILAERLNIDPFEIRLKNAFRKGSQTATKQVLEHSVGIIPTIEAAREKAKELFGIEGGKRI